MKSLTLILLSLVFLVSSAFGDISFSLVKLSPNIVKKDIPYISAYAVRNDAIAFYISTNTRDFEGIFGDIKESLGSSWKVERLYNFGDSSVGGPYSIILAYIPSKILIMDYTVDYIGSDDSVEELTLSDHNMISPLIVSIYIFDEVDISQEKFGLNLQRTIQFSQWFNQTMDTKNSTCIIGQFPMRNPVEYVDQSLNIGDCIAPDVGSYVGDTNTTKGMEFHTTHILYTKGNNTFIRKAFVSDYFKNDSIVEIKPPYVVFSRPKLLGDLDTN